MCSSLHLAREVIRSQFGTPARPFKLTWALTYHCNSRCRTCNIWQRSPISELELSDFEMFFRKNSFLAWLDLTGGEITLRDDFVEIAQAAIQYLRNLYLLHFPTNGLLTEKLVRGVRNILDVGPRQLIVTVSIDGPREVHDRIRGGKGFFDRAVESLRRLKELESSNFRVFPGMTLSLDNLGLIRETAAMLAREIPDFSPTDLHINLAEVSSHFYGNEGMNTLFKREALKEVQSWRETSGLRHLGAIGFMERAYQRLAGVYLAGGVTPISCRSGGVSCFVDPEGEIYPCSIYAERLGNLRDYKFDLTLAWKSEKFNKIRQLIKQGQCPQCWTPCEAYQTLLSNLPALLRWGLF